MEEQLRRQPEHLTQIRSLPVSATRRRRWGGEPRRREAKYWPEPVGAPEVRGELAERRRRSAARRWEGEGRGVRGSKGNLRYSSVEEKECCGRERRRKKEREKREGCEDIVEGGGEGRNESVEGEEGR